MVNINNIVDCGRRYFTVLVSGVNDQVPVGRHPCHPPLAVVLETLTLFMPRRARYSQDTASISSSRPGWH